MLVVADTSPLNYLVWIELEHLLPQLYGRVLIPQAVLQELSADRSPDAVRAWVGKLPQWAEVWPTDTFFLEDQRYDSLDSGEREAIQLALHHPASLLLIDERAGTTFARSLGLSVTGTLGVLDEAAQRKMISLPAAIARLRQTSFRYPKSIVERMLIEDSKRT